MSYDTTVNDALDPPESRFPARTRSVWRVWIVSAVLLTLLSAAACGWLWLR